MRRHFSILKFLLGLRAISVAIFVVAVIFISQRLSAQSLEAHYNEAQWVQIVAAAKQEGKVMIYSTALPNVNERLAADFEKAYPGMRMEFVRLSGYVLTSKAEQEHNAGIDGADALIVNDMLWVTNAIKSGWLMEPIGPASVEWPARYLVGGKSPTAALEPYSIVYNTDLVKTPVTGYLDVVKPAFNQRIGVYSLISRGIIAWYDWLADNFGADYVQALAAKKLNFYGSSSSSTQAVASGEIGIDLGTNPSAAAPLIAQGAPIKLINPKRAMGSLYNFAALSWSKRSKAALVALDYIMSRRGQTVWSGTGTSASPLANIPGSLIADSVEGWDAAKYTDEVSNAKTEQWNVLFKPK